MTWDDLRDLLDGEAVIVDNPTGEALDAVVCFDHYIFLNSECLACGNKITKNPGVQK
jgi:hypothetical protein